MGEINKASNSYRELVAAGVSVQVLQCLSFNDGIWIVRCLKSKSLPRDKAKRAVTAYLTSEFEAKELQFHAKRDAIDTRFEVTFVTYAL